jgi:hypothetical protein
VTLRSHTNVEKPDLNVDIELSEPVSLTFSLKYLVNFCKAAALATQVKICLSNEVPLLVEYDVTSGSYLRFYLAPKVSSNSFCGIFDSDWLTRYFRLARKSKVLSRGRCYETILPLSTGVERVW